MFCWQKVSAEGYEPHEEPFDVMGDEATVLNVTLRRLAVSLSSTSSSPTLLPTGTVEDASGSTNMTSPSDPDDSSGDGNTQDPNGINPNNSMTTPVTMTTLGAVTPNNETTPNDLPTNPDVTAANDGSNEDDKDEGDGVDVPSDNEGVPDPWADPVKSAVSIPVAFGGGITMRLCLTLITACTIFCSKMK